jgi:hypothetical protein
LTSSLEQREDITIHENIKLGDIVEYRREWQDNNPFVETGFISKIQKPPVDKNPYHIYTITFFSSIPNLLYNSINVLGYSYQITWRRIEQVKV